MRALVIGMLLAGAGVGLCQDMGGMSLLGVTGSDAKPDAAAIAAAAAPAPKPEPPRTYHVTTAAQLDRIMARPGYWKKYISGSEGLTGAEARYHYRKAEVDSWGSWAGDYLFGSVATLASPGEIAPWTFRNVTYREYYGAYDEYLRNMNDYGYLAPDVYKQCKAWVDKKRY